MIRGSNPGIEKKYLFFFFLKSQTGSVAHVYRGVSLAINSIWCRVIGSSLPLAHAMVFKHNTNSLTCWSVRSCSGNHLVHKKRPCSGWLLLFLVLNGLRNNTVLFHGDYFALGRTACAVMNVCGHFGRIYGLKRMTWRWRQNLPPKVGKFITLPPVI